MLASTSIRGYEPNRFDFDSGSSSDCSSGPIVLDRVQEASGLFFCTYGDSSNLDEPYDMDVIVLDKSKQRKLRRVVSIDHNFTASRLELPPSARGDGAISMSHSSSDSTSVASCTSSDTDDLVSLDSDRGYTMFDFRDAVTDHAARRVSLFYHVLVAYANSGCRVEKARTSLQHGLGMRDGWSAAHSHLLPSVSDNYFEVLISKLRTDGFDDQMEQQLQALAVSEETLEILRGEGATDNAVNAVYAELQEHGLGSLFTVACHLYHSLNSTVILPYVVNQVDCAVEDELREFALSIVNEVSMGQLSPYEGLQKLFDGDPLRRRAGLDMHFRRARQATEVRRDKLRELHAIDQKLFELEARIKTGGYSEQQVMSYLVLIRQSAAARKEFRAHRDHTVGYNVRKRMTTHHILYQLSTRLGVPATRKRRKKGRRSRLRVEVNAAPTVQNDRLLRRVYDEVCRLPEWNPDRLKGGITLFEDAYEVIRFQACGTDLPEESLLLETVRCGEEVTEEALAAQQRINIRRQYNLAFS